MKKMLMLATVPSMIGQFNISNIQILRQLGYEVHVACNFEDFSVWDKKKIDGLKEKLEEIGVLCHQVSISRKPYKLIKNYRSCRYIIKLVRRHGYDFVHCHTPVGGVLGRIVGINCGIKVIYTAHGFHFYKGAPIQNWIFYYPIENFFSFFTEILITINQEDYKRARQSFHANKTEYIPGVGFNVEKYKNVLGNSVNRKELDIPANAFVLISVGELNKNKNHQVVINAISLLNNPNIHFVICGTGSLENKLKSLIKKKRIEAQIHLLGFREDVGSLCKIADAFIFPSLREGLGIAALEGMAAGLPLIASEVHGIKDYSKNKITGIAVKSNSAKSFAAAINELVKNPEICKMMGEKNIMAAEQFSNDRVDKLMRKIYMEI